MREQKKINVKIDEKIGEGIYANAFLVAFSNSEFILDFGRTVPHLADLRIFSRIITTPQHVKQFLKNLEKNIENYEKQHGEIKMPGSAEDKNIGFKSSGQNS